MKVNGTIANTTTRPPRAASSGPKVQFRNWITPDGAPGPTGAGGFARRAGRYHLYVSLACPWAHRTLILRELKGLARILPISVDPLAHGTEGWTFERAPASSPTRSMARAAFTRSIWRAASTYTGRVTVPILWDKQTPHHRLQRISRHHPHVELAPSTASAPPPRLLPRAAPGRTSTPCNAEIYDRVNNGVYKAGFASNQSAYEEAVAPLFATLDRLEALLGKQRYLCGTRITEADWRLFTTLVRFDPVYFGHFKCNIRRLVDYPNLWPTPASLYQCPGVRATVHFEHIKRHYYESHAIINPTRIVPVGPTLTFDHPVTRVIDACPA